MSLPDALLRKRFPGFPVRTSAVPSAASFPSDGPDARCSVFLLSMTSLDAAKWRQSLSRAGQGSSCCGGSDTRPDVVFAGWMVP
jgi:hypothetical protein